MARVTDAEVKEIIELDTSLVTTTAPFITAANLLVTNVLEAYTAIVLSAAELKEIERWLAAHFCAIKDMRRDTEKAGPVSESFQYKLNDDLRTTMYGQQAIVLDRTGQLAMLGGKGKVAATIRAINPDLND